MIISGVICLGILIRNIFIRVKRRKRTGIILDLFSAVLIFCFSILLLSTILEGSLSLSERLERYNYERVKNGDIGLVPMAETPGTTGSCYLLTRESGEDYYYVTMSAEGPKIGSIESKDCQIIRRDSVSPHIETYHVTGFKNWTRYIFSCPLSRDCYIAMVPDGDFMEISFFD